jgi:hypothetical protein
MEGFYALANAALGETPAAIHWDYVVSTLKEANGLPQMVGLEIDPADLPPGFSPEAPPLPQPAPSPQPTPVTPAAISAPAAPAAPAQP